MGLPLQISHEEFGIIWGSLFKLVLSNFGIIRMFWPYLPLYTILLSLSGHSFFPQRVYIDLSEIYSDIYRLLRGVFYPSPDLSPSRPYQPEPEGRGLILSEG